jgi:ABC-type sugar transport system ATPase subunit
LFFRLIDIKKSYREKGQARMVLKGINLDINEGNFLSFVGPSGAGKTTLLLIIAGLIRPSAGDLYFDYMKLTPH